MASASVAAKSDRAKLIAVLRGLGFLLSLGLVVYVVVRGARDIHPSRLTWWPIPIAFAAMLAWWLGLARGWSLLIAGRTTYADLSLWCRTQAYRYLPGGIWAPVSRVTVTQGRVAKRISVVVAENVLSLCGALAVGGAALAAAGRWYWAPLVLVLAVPVLAVRYLPERVALDPERTRLATLNFVAAFLVYAAGAVLVQGAVSGFHHSLVVAGAAAVAWGVGLVVVVAPSGVGVREVVYVGLAAHGFGSGQLAAGAVTMRVLATVAELLVLLAVGRPRKAPPRGRSDSEISQETALF